jgi:hypothetical protein
VVEQPVVDRAAGENLFKATVLISPARMVSGTVQDNPVIEIVLKLRGVGPAWHPAGRDPARCRHHRGDQGLEGLCAEALAAAAARASGRRRPHRDRQGARAAARHHRGGQRRVGLSPAGRLDGQLRLIVANLDKFLPALVSTRCWRRKQRVAAVNNAFGALDRIMPGPRQRGAPERRPAIVPPAST